MERSVLAVFLAGYCALVLAVGFLARRRMKGADDFFFASRRMPGGLVFVSLTAGWFGASSILVTTDSAFRSGTGAFWLIGAPAVITILVLTALVRPLRSLPDSTLPELAGRVYGPWVRRAAAVILIWYLALLAASQLTALGGFLGTLLGWPYSACLALGSAVVLAYSLAGGLRSVAATDALQCLLLAAAVAALVLNLAGRAPAGEAAAAAARAAGPGYFNIFADFGRNGLVALSFVLAWTISPIALQRIQAARSEKAARLGLGGSAAALLVLYGLAVGAGILALPLVTVPVPRDQLVPLLIRESLGPALGGLLFAAVLAAIFSTLDTALNAGALALTRDVFGRIGFLRKRGELALSRGALAVIALAAFLVAARLQDILKTIGLASEILAEGFFIPGLAMILFPARRRPWAGGASLALGGGFAILSFASASGLLPLGLPVWPRSLPYGLALSAAGYAAGAVRDARRF